MQYKLIIYSNDGNEMFISRSADLDDLYSDVRHFKETPAYTEEHQKELDNLPF